jgi:hypothetical protein
MKFVQAHVNAATTERDALVLKAQALFHAGSALQLNMAAGANHAVPGYGSVRCAQRPGNLPGMPRIAGRARHCTVRGDFASRDFPNRPD